MDVRIYRNPVQRGFFPDPSVVRVGDDYYMVNSSFQYFPAIPVSHSRDMVHWHIIGFAVTDSSWLDLAYLTDSRGIWAPDIAYHNGRFYIIATYRLNSNGKTDENVLRRKLIVSSDTPEGPYSRPAWIEVDSIDPSLFFDDDGQNYLIISPGVQAVPLSSECMRVTGGMRSVWPGMGEHSPEGPHVLKKDGWYY